MKISRLLFTLLAGLVVSLSTSAQTPPVDKNGLAIGGYDVVSYFSGEANKGEARYSVKHKGAKYLFSSKENQQKFEKNPTDYLPQFNGYCAWGVSEKQVKFPINPETYDIVDGKLYLFFNGPFNGQPFNTIESWNQETTRMVKDSHKHWPKVKKLKDL